MDKNVETETCTKQPIFDAIIERLESINQRIQGVDNVLYNKADKLFGSEPPLAQEKEQDEVPANSATERVNVAVNNVLDSLCSLENTQSRFADLV